MKVSVIDGDVTAVPAQVLITAINSGDLGLSAQLRDLLGC